MLSKKKNKPEFPRVCEYCEYASALSDTDKMLCSKKGVVLSGYRCRHFRYDLLKRVPTPPPPISLPDLSDMSIEDDSPSD